MSEIDLEELRSELSDYAKPVKAEASSAKEQRIIAGFEEIERFVEQYGRLPQHGENSDIFERLYAVRLECLRASEECRAVLNGRDSRGLLGRGTHDAMLTASVREDPAEYGLNAVTDTELSDEELLAALGGEDSFHSDITALKHVRSRDEIRLTEEIAKRTPCKDFEVFRPEFEKVQRELQTGQRQTLKYKDNAEVKINHLFILEGQKVLVAEMGEEFISDSDRPDRRLRVIFDNGTESNLLLRSLQRALNRDKSSRRITEPDHGPLFSSETDEEDLSSGCIYILRSKSENAFVAQNRTVLHKIGVTGGDVKARIANAKKDPTYLLAEVEIVAIFKLVNINPRRLEALLHNFFARARVDFKLKDRFGFDVTPREWFLLPLPVIEETIEKLKDGTIHHYCYDAKLAQLARK